jgi:NADPH-dependent ferric siderophore reductase
MSTAPLAAPPVPRRPGRLTQALARLFMKQATIAEATDVGGGFHVIALESPQFRAASWAPGHKLQIAVSGSLTYRTYTPVEWDGERGRTWIIAYAHGAAPGSDWARHARPGDSCEVFGPRASLDLGATAPPSLLFGDETTFGLAASLQHQPTAGPVHCLFEVNSADTVRAALDLESFGIGNATLFDRLPADAHLDAIAARALAAAADAGPATRFILTGKATSIQRLRAALKQHGVPASRMLSKPYWSPGKKGLD